MFIADNSIVWELHPAFEQAEDDAGFPDFAQADAADFFSMYCMM